VITWDEPKRRLNLRKHGFDFVDAELMFDAVTYTYEDDRLAYGEQRFVTLGLLRDTVVSVVHTEHGDHITSSRCERRRSVSGKSTSRTSRTDWARVRVLRDRDIKTGSDHPEADTAHMVRGIVRRGLKAPPRKESISLRVDLDVLKWFRVPGRGWQARMNAALRAYKDASKPRALARRSNGRS
jgi:uncharacterized protein